MTGTDKLTVKPARGSEDPGDEVSRVQELAGQLRSPDFVASLLLEKGITTTEAARAFFLAPLDHCHDPADMAGMQETVAQLIAVHQSGQPVVVHGDYDVDGIAATALLYAGMKSCGFKISWLLPDRFVHGYGVSKSTVDLIHQRGAKWIVTVDTGISASEAIRYAQSLGIGVLVTDHHRVDEESCGAHSVINPNQPGCPYRNKNLSGSGVAFKLLTKLYQHFHNRDPMEYLYLVALGSLADMVSVTRENRSLIKHGLHQLSQSKHYGIRALLQNLNLPESGVGSGEVVFKLAPLLNSAGRLGRADKALKLLLAQTEAEAEASVQSLLEDNQKRQELDKQLTERATRQAEDEIAAGRGRCLVVAGEGWHEGVIGIVAARLVDHFRRPVFVLAIQDGIAKGSGRTVEGFDLFQALTTTQELFTAWGGHTAACGFTLPERHIEQFRAKMNQLAPENVDIPEESFSDGLSLPFDELNDETMLWLKRLEPFGTDNERPRFLARGVKLMDHPRVVGGKHLKLCLGHEHRFLDAIGFNMAHREKKVVENSQDLTIIYSPEWNWFRGQKKMQIRILAIQ